MPYDLPLPKAQRLVGWKVKTHDFERLEEPHVIDARVKEFIETAWEALQVEWNEIHPDNPVRGEEHDDDDV